MPLADLTNWMDEFTGYELVWYVKRLAANDTLAKSHQAGTYIPKKLAFEIFPSLNNPTAENPRIDFNLRIDSHADSRPVTAIWYNNKLRGKTRDETRITNLGGGSSALLDPESTGAIAVFIFVLNESKTATECHVWVCDDEVQEGLVEDRIGIVEPGQGKIWTVQESYYPSLFAQPHHTHHACWLETDQIPSEWLVQFPTGLEIVRKTLELRPDNGLSPDERLWKRRACEFEIFRSLEEAIELPQITQGFKSVDEFIARAQTILQRRKARSGRSLELHIREIFLEERLQEDINFSHQPESEPGHKPDFLFPSQSAYKNDQFPDSNLRMLAAKTTCKDRWRQILTEANRVAHKHLLTLQEGVSEKQFAEMVQENVQLIVPTPLVSKYPTSVQPHLMTLESFIADVRLLSIQRD